MASIDRQQYDIVVVGGTPSGIAAAVAAAREGRSVAVIEYHGHLGGMAVAGLGKSDIEKRHLVRGVFGEFVGRVRAHYAQRYGLESVDFAQCRDGYYYEPSVAERVLDSMLAEQDRITVYRSTVVERADAEGGVLRQIAVRHRHIDRTAILQAQVFVDATYEGDLYAMAGAAFRVGREARDEYGEPHAGAVYFDSEKRQFLPGSTGAGDDRLPAYTYRLCLTSDPGNSYRLSRAPENYDRMIFLPYLEDLAAGRLAGPQRLVDGRGYEPRHFNTLVRALSVTTLPNRKADANINPRPLAFPFPEENDGYVGGDLERRESICRRHRELTLGLLYFLQNDSAVPPEHRRLANEYHLPLDEFTDNDHFPFQLYVREARRLKGCHTLTEHDVARTEDAPEPPTYADAIAVGEFPIDSFPVRKRQPGDAVALEGYLCMLDHVTRPYQIPYRIMIPETLDGVIVPVAVSATHVAYSSLRMEPTWMALGHAAGVAAHLAIERRQKLRDVPVDLLQQRLVAAGQIIRPAEGEAIMADSARDNSSPSLPHPHLGIHLKRSAPTSDMEIG